MTIKEDHLTRLEAIRSWALNQIGSAYVYGATGGLCTPQLRRDRIQQYPHMQSAITQYCPVLRGDFTACAGCRHYGRSAFDCAQFTRRALQTGGLMFPSGATSQWRAGAYHIKGEFRAVPKGVLCLLFRQDGDQMQHVGLHLGDGRVVDARSHKAGVVLTQLHDYPWTHYAVPAIGEAQKAPPLTLGARGEAVRDLQRLLVHQGEPLPRYGIDGHFGLETLGALNAVQRRLGLSISPHAGAEMLEKLKTAPPRSRTVEERLQALERHLQACPQPAPSTGRSA